MVRSTTERVAVGFVALWLVAIAVAPAVIPAAAAASAARTRPGVQGGRTAATAGRLAPVVRVDGAGVTYRLPSGTDVTLTRGGPLFQFPSGVIHFTSRGTAIAPDGTRYGLEVSASRFLGSNQGGTDVFVLLHRVSSGAAGAAVQFHGYDFQLPKSALQYARTGPVAVISTGTGMADFGAIRLSFSIKRAPTPSCGGKNERWRGASSGTFTLTPRGDDGFFGTVTRSSFGSAALDVRRGCLGFPTSSQAHKPPDCPAQTFDVDGTATTETRYTEVFGAPDPNPGAADEVFDYQVLRDPALSIHEVQAVVPSAGVKPGPHRTVRLATYPDTFLSGSAEFLAKGAGVVDGPFRCGKGRQVTFRSAFGPMTGAVSNPLTAHFDTGPVSMPTDVGEALSGEYDRTIVK